MEPSYLSLLRARVIDIFILEKYPLDRNNDSNLIYIYIFIRKTTGVKKWLLKSANLRTHFLCPFPFKSQFFLTIFFSIINNNKNYVLNRIRYFFLG